MSRAPTDEEVGRVYEEFWRDLIETDGEIDMQKLKNELYDYRTLLREVPKVYDHVTGGRISKPNTLAFEVTAAADEFYDGLCMDDEETA